MHEASFESILKTVLIILLIYFGFKIFIKWFGPLILKWFLKRIGQKFQQQFNNQAAPKTQKKGEVKIETDIPKTSNSNKKVGEYIDFEEID
ncbi:hypothetical protein BC962_1204 [Gillisia mitskevichiae]|uniref:DUF4834 domain-containing protein n=1 Tax=Gillisia mitskevichiae TaxID=270921 RepID=A0A495PW45_9FLAO|nr:DUF4834 domain-containing protein [Gillisia mitskevichiae]RKS52959.1 hypothetical protein BC962_1204 [Gillisia mitskevichiae]